MNWRTNKYVWLDCWTLFICFISWYHIQNQMVYKCVPQVKRQRRTRSIGSKGGRDRREMEVVEKIVRGRRTCRSYGGKKVLGVRGSSKATIGQCSRTTREEHHIFLQNFKALDTRITFFIYLTLYQTLESSNPAPPPCRTRALLPRVGGVWGAT